MKKLLENTIKYYGLSGLQNVVNYEQVDNRNRLTNLKSRNIKFFFEYELNEKVIKDVIEIQVPKLNSDVEIKNFIISQINSKLEV